LLDSGKGAQCGEFSILKTYDVAIIMSPSLFNIITNERMSSQKMHSKSCPLYPEVLYRHLQYCIQFRSFLPQILVLLINVDDIVDGIWNFGFLLRSTINSNRSFSTKIAMYMLRSLQKHVWTPMSFWAAARDSNDDDDDDDDILVNVIQA